MCGPAVDIRPTDRRDIDYVIYMCMSKTSYVTNYVCVYWRPIMYVHTKVQSCRSMWVRKINYACVYERQIYYVLLCVENTTCGCIYKKSNYEMCMLRTNYIRVYKRPVMRVYERPTMYAYTKDQLFMCTRIPIMWPICLCRPKTNYVSAYRRNNYIRVNERRVMYGYMYNKLGRLSYG